MEFTNTFRVPVDVDTTFATLTDLEKVAPCLPGATLEEVDGDRYTGRVKVKVGPITVIYKGTAEVTDADGDAKRARIEATGKETRGSGTASANVVATMEEVEDGTEVTVVTDLNITGKPAQFGRGVMADVGSRIIGAFADRLRDLVTEDDRSAGTAAAATAGGPEAVATGATAAATPPAGDAEAPSGPRRIAPDPSREDDALDLMDVAGAATAKRLLPIVLLLVVGAAVVWWLRHR
jgi:uncharacterized protein